MTPRRAGVSLWLLLALSAAGCGTAPRERFYTLSEPPAGATPTARSDIAVAIGPISVPEIVDRPQMVVRASDNRVEVEELHRWAEPLRSEIPRVLAAHLRRALGTERIATDEQGASLHADYWIAIDVLRFESTLGTGVMVEALWSVRAAKGGQARTGRTLVREPAAGNDHEALAAAYSRALARLARDLAAALRRPR
jgi:uncharacterized lipoprotein YmbA